MEEPQYPVTDDDFVDDVPTEFYNYLDRKRIKDEYIRNYVAGKPIHNDCHVVL